ncbi:MAG: hypothetical protein KC425_25130, partial [Anaerolineales bacterium]|nr:hypothetical protein [Anaerolineales bacterium]
MPAQSLDPRRDAFARADYAGRCRLVEEALATAAPDDDLIFDWLDDLAADAATPADHAQFAALCAQLRTAAPDVYAEVAGDLLAWRIAHALLDGRFADLPPLTAELAPLAADFPEAVVASADRLAYAGQLPLLADLLRRAWPHLQMGDFEEWEVEQFAVQAMNYAILDFVARTDAADAADPALLTLLDEFAEIDAAALAEHLAQIT